MPIRNEYDFDELRRGALAYAVIAAWSGVGALEALRDGEPRPLSALPGDPRALERTAAILAHVGLLVGDGTTWALTRSGRALLEAGVLRFAGADAALGDLSRLDRVLREGGPVRGADGTSRVTEGGVREHDREGSRAFLEYLWRRSADSVGEVARWLAPRVKAGARALDLGGGHGRYGRALADAGLAVTLFDRGLVVELARERHGDALSYRSGDFLVDDVGGPYDVVLLSNIVHGLGPGESAGLFARLREATAPGGLIVFKDMFLDEHGAQPAEAAYFDLTMLMYTREGRTYRVGELRALMRAAGFADGEHVYFTDSGYSLLVGRRT